MLQLGEPGVEYAVEVECGRGLNMNIRKREMRHMEVKELLESSDQGLKLPVRRPKHAELSAA
jgi:hypothetical protein